MTDAEYLENLNLIEGSGDKKGVTKTSSKYGITNAGIERVTRNIRLGDGKGNYTENALQIQGMLDKKLLKVLMDNLEWKGGTLTKHANVDQVGKLGEKAWEQLALVTRELNRRKINNMGGAPLDEEVIDRICLAAHNREALLKDKKVQDAIMANNEDVLRHELMNNFDYVTKDVLPGIRRRMACLFNPDWKNRSVADAWKSYDKEGKPGINKLVQIDYDKDQEAERERIRKVSLMQAGDSQVTEKYKPSKNPKPLPNENEFVGALFPKPLPMNNVKPEQPKQPIAAPKPAKEPSFWERVGRAAMTALNPFYGLSSGNSNQVAQNEENILNNPNGEKA